MTTENRSFFFFYFTIRNFIEKFYFTIRNFTENGLESDGAVETRMWRGDGSPAETH